MSTLVFHDIETYAAYCYLVAECWKEVQSLGGVPIDLADIARGFCRKFQENSAKCTPADADRWCRTLATDPFAECMREQWSGLVDCLRPRISRAVAACDQIDDSDALAWIVVLETIVRAGARANGLLESMSKCLQVVADRPIPRHVAQRAFDMLESLSSDTAKPVVKALRQLEQIALPSGQDLWESPVYRQALWASVLGDPERDAKDANCLRDLFQQILADEEAFRRWTDAWCALEHAGVRLEAS
jgi:hypothetical protein